MTVRAAVLTATITAALAVAAATQLHVGDATPTPEPRWCTTYTAPNVSGTRCYPTRAELLAHRLQVERDQAARRVARAYRAGYHRGARDHVHRPSVNEAIRLASLVYEVPESTLRNVAWCESRLDPNADNPDSTAGGLFQFLAYPTWRSNPFGKAGFSRYSPYASALAAARVIRHGEGLRPWAASRHCWAGR